MEAARQRAVDKSNKQLESYSSPYTVKVRKEVAKQRKVEVDLETGDRKSWVESTEFEVLDLTGETPAKKHCLGKLPIKETIDQNKINVHELASEDSQNKDDYGLDLKSDEETDDEDCPRKQVPKWALGTELKASLLKQCYMGPDLDEIFYTVEMPDLSTMFDLQRKRFSKRTSSALWESPPVKRNLTDVLIVDPGTCPVCGRRFKGVKGVNAHRRAKNSPCHLENENQTNQSQSVAPLEVVTPSPGASTSGMTSTPDNTSPEDSIIIITDTP